LASVAAFARTSRGCASDIPAAAQEARRRNLLPKEKDGPKGPPSLVVGTKTGATVTESGTDGK